MPKTVLSVDRMMLLITDAAIRVAGAERIGPDAALTLVIMAQAAVSVVGWNQIAKVASPAGAGELAKAYSTEFAFDIVGYSFPISIVLNSAACLGRDWYVPNIAPIGSAYVLAAVALFGVFRKQIQDAPAFLPAAKDS